MGARDRQACSSCDCLARPPHGSKLRGLRAAGHEATITAKTGLLLDLYFSASKIGWLLTMCRRRARAEAGELACGTIDSWLVWQLTKGASHATDATNAARTSLYNIHDNKWDGELLSLFNVPSAILPEVKDCAADFGTSEAEVLGVCLPICGIAGDQQAAAFGQACFTPGMVKSTYGTGCFVLANTGDRPVASGNCLLTTIGYRLNGQNSYALEGSIFMAGAIVQWLRDGLGIVQKASDSEALVAQPIPTAGRFLCLPLPGLVRRTGRRMRGRLFST